MSTASTAPSHHPPVPMPSPLPVDGWTRFRARLRTLGCGLLWAAALSVRGLVAACVPLVRHSLLTVAWLYERYLERPARWVYRHRHDGQELTRELTLGLPMWWHRLRG